MKRLFALLISVLMIVTVFTGCSSKKEIKEINVTNLPLYFATDENGENYLSDENGNQIHFEISEEDSEKYEKVSGAILQTDDGLKCLALLRPKTGYEFVDGFTINNDLCKSACFTDETCTTSSVIKEEDLDSVRNNFVSSDVQLGDVSICWNITELNNSKGVTGRWISEHDTNAEFFLLNFNEDGTGSIISSDHGTGLGLMYEVNDTEIMTHMGSVEDDTPMTYLKDSDQIVYGDEIYDRLDEEDGKIVGVWESEFTEIGQEYTILVFDNDGSGSVTNMPMDIGLAFRYEITGDDIMTHMGSFEDETPMTYLPESDQISYNDVLYTRAGN